METNSKTTNMETTKELIAHVNDLVCAAKPIADKCEWMIFTPKTLDDLALDQFAELCEWRSAEPSELAGRFRVTVVIDGVSVAMQTERIPELLVRKKASVLDLIKSILADRKAQASAA